MAKFRQAYPTDLNDTEWSVIAQLLPQPKKMSRPRKHTYREILNAIFYIVRSGCAWRLMAHDLPPWNKLSVGVGEHGAREAGMDKLPVLP